MSARNTIVEIGAIIVLAGLAGLAWNHKLLTNAWTGKAPAAVSASPSPGPSEAMPLPVGLDQVKDMYDRKEAVIVDARDPATFAGGHIKGAVSLPVGEAEGKMQPFLKQYPAPTLLIVYCNGYGCHDSMELGKKLIKAGYASVYVFEGGYPEWKDAGYTVEGTAP